VHLADVPPDPFALVFDVQQSQGQVAVGHDGQKGSALPAGEQDVFLVKSVDHGRVVVHPEQHAAFDFCL